MRDFRAPRAYFFFRATLVVVLFFADAFRFVDFCVAVFFFVDFFFAATFFLAVFFFPVGAFFFPALERSPNALAQLSE